ncbi:MAG: glycosyltransferase family 4 protein [bacterium]
MRIGIVTQSYFPIRGGVAEHVYHTAVELENRGHQVTIITANFSRFDEDRGREVVRIGHDLTIPMNGAFVNVTLSLRFAHQIKTIEQQKKFDIVHIHGPVEPILPLYAVRFFQCPKVGTFHAFSARPMLSYLAFHNQLQFYFDNLDSRIAVSEAARSFISQHFPGEYIIIPNGVDVNRFNPGVQPFSWYHPDKEFTILFVGRMDPRKGLKYLLRAFSLIVREVSNAKLIVIGNGLLRQWYERYVEPELRSQVQFLGFVSADELPRYYASCDVYCSPAVGNESFGIVLLEALATGKPVVASDIAGYRGVIRNNQDGLLVERANPLAIAEAIIALAKDKQKRQKFGQVGRERAVAFSWKTVTGQIEKIYHKVIEDRQKAGKG